MKRMGIFLFYDAEGIVDDYVKFLLDDIVQNLTCLYIIVNGKLTQESEKILKNYTSEILIRSNLGFDAGAFKDAMIDQIGFEKLEEFDEVILFNDSFFGPIYPFNEMFGTMDKKDMDFWGITVHGEAPDNANLTGYGYRPRYLQTYFLAFRKRMVKSKEFQDYWKNLEYFKDFNDLAFKHGAIFTKHFEDLGFKWEPYIDTKDIEMPRENAMSFHTFDMYNMVVNRKLPIIKRKAFKLPKELHLNYNLARDIPATMNYLKENTDYDVDLIYKYFLRTMDPYELYNILDLVKIIPKHGDMEIKTNKKVAVIAHLYYTDLWEYAFNYLKNIPKYIDIIITTNSDEKKAFFEKAILKKLKNNTQIIIVNPRGRDIAALLVGCKEIIKDYDCFCFMHDKKSEGKEYITIGASFRDLLWENSLASPNYINSIVKEFDDNPALGLIVPPKVYQGTYFYTYKNKYWTLCFDEAKDLLEKMGIDAKISKEYPPLSIGSCFWAKYDALKPLFDLDLEYEDFPSEPLPADGTISHAIERIHCYVAASQGYYTEEMMTDDYGRTELSNYRYMFLKTIEKIDKNAQKNTVKFNRGFKGFIDTLNNGLNNKKLNSNLKKVKTENKKLKKINNKQSKEIANMKNSKSWKITKPLRKLKPALKRRNESK